MMKKDFQMSKLQPSKLSNDRSTPEGGAEVAAGARTRPTGYGIDITSFGMSFLYLILYVITCQCVLLSCVHASDIIYSAVCLSCCGLATTVAHFD